MLARTGMKPATARDVHILLAYYVYKEAACFLMQRSPELARELGIREPPVRSKLELIHSAPKSANDWRRHLPKTSARPSDVVDPDTKTNATGDGAPASGRGQAS